jgi:hypothetical protein
LYLPRCLPFFFPLVFLVSLALSLTVSPLSHRLSPPLSLCFPRSDLSLPHLFFSNSLSLLFRRSHLLFSLPLALPFNLSR